MKKLASAATAFVALTLTWQAVPSAWAEPGSGPRFGQMAGRLADVPTSRILEMMTKRLDLTEDQQQKIGAILEETRQSMKAPAAERREIGDQAREKIAQVLTPEQRGKAEKMKHALFAGVGGYLKAHGPQIRERLEGAGDEMRLRAALSTLDLTDEQVGKLKEIQEDVQARREAIMEEVKPKVEALKEEVKGQIAGVLTPEQQEELKQKMSELPKRPGHFGRGSHGPRAEGRPGHFDRWSRGPRAEGRPGPPPPPPSGGPDENALADLFR